MPFCGKSSCALVLRPVCNTQEELPAAERHQPIQIVSCTSLDHSESYPPCKNICMGLETTATCPQTLTMQMPTYHGMKLVWRCKQAYLCLRILNEDFILKPTCTQGKRQRHSLRNFLPRWKSLVCRLTFCWLLMVLLHVSRCQH